MPGEIPLSVTVPTGFTSTSLQAKDAKAQWAVGGHKKIFLPGPKLPSDGWHLLPFSATGSRAAHKGDVIQVAADRMPLWFCNPGFLGTVLRSDKNEIRVTQYRLFPLYFVAIAAAWTQVPATRPFLLSGTSSIQLVDSPPEPTATYSKRIAGASFSAVADDVPAGDLTIDLWFLDRETKAPNQRVMSVFVNGQLIEPRFDLWRAAGGTGKPFQWSFAYSHAGGRLAVSLTGIGTDAVLSAVQVSLGKALLASGTAATMPRLRETLRDARFRSFRPVHVGEVPFFNVDHSPTGAYATFIYGMEDSGGIQNTPGRRAMAGDLVPHDGVIVAAKSGTTIRVMPFSAQLGGLADGATYVRENEVRHVLGASTDHWEMPMGVKWTHYSPYWPLPDIETAVPEAKERFCLPATWMVFDFDNRANNSSLEFLFSLKQRGAQVTKWKDFEGYTIDQTTALAVHNGDARTVNAGEARRRFGVDGATSGFLVEVAPRQRKSITVIVAHYLPGPLSELGGEPLAYLYTTFFSDLGEVIRAAGKLQPAAIAQSGRMNQLLSRAGISAERQFVAAHALHSYQFNTILRQSMQSHRPLWTVPEGEYGYANTFDLTIDQIFFELAMHPWTVRNELDTFLQYFSYVDELRHPGRQERFPGGIGFTHDMGSGVNLVQRTQQYNGSMTQEELQNWILSAGLYWHATRDDAWLKRNRNAIERCLRSMQARDDVDPARRDGITSMLSVVGRRDHDITTYDAMDESLQQVNDSLYIAVKSFASYLALQSMFRQLGDLALAEESSAAAGATVTSILRHWDAANHFFPALFDGHSDSRIVPAVEGLAYPFEMGLRREIAANGPYSELITRLKEHLNTVLTPGQCLDPTTGGWRLSSTSQTTWESKVYLAQFIAENILGMNDARTHGAADVAHVAYQVLGAPAVGWSDQIRHTDGSAYGGRHYPRGVTNSLWWLPVPHADER